MTIKLHLSQLPLEHVGFGYSVLSELLRSLNVLNSHKRHPLHISWVLEANRQLSAEIRAEYRRLQPVIATVSASMLFLDTVDTPDFELELGQIASLSSQQFAVRLLADFLVDESPYGRRIWKKNSSLETFQQSTTLQNQVKDWLSRYYGLGDELVRQLQHNPEQLQQRFLMLIRNYWDTFFQKEWQRLEAIILEEIASSGRRLLKDGIVPMVAEISERFSSDLEQQIATYVRSGEDEVRVLGKADSLNLYPSYFTYPSLIFSFHHNEVQNRQTISIIYPMPQQRHAGRPPVPSDQLLTILRGVADSTRLQILQLVAEKPRSTSELARIIGISDAAISKQVKQMQQAGWVQSRRESYYVLYQATAVPLEQLNRGLTTLLEPSTSPDNGSI